MTTQVQLEEIYYANTNKRELTARTVISTVPKDTTLVIDVTGLPPVDQTSMVDLYQRYMEYADAYHKNIISFESWAAQSDNVSVNPQWRALVTSHIIKP